MDPDLLALGPIWYVAFLLSLTCHEAAHALVAKWGGDLTAYEGGQVTLNPLPHIQREPFGTVLVPLISLFLSGYPIGWASAPYDPYWARRHPHRAGWMALAGPAANFILAILAGLVMRLGLAAGFFTFGQPGFTNLVLGSGGFSDGAAIFCSILFSLNVLLGAFNLLPVPPLDGITVLGLFLPERTAGTFADWIRGSPLSMFGLLIAWQIFGPLFRPVYLTALNLLFLGL